MKRHVKLAMTAAVAAGMVLSVLAEEVVVSRDKMAFWMGPDESEMARAVSRLWMGPDEIDMGEDSEPFAFMPPWSWQVGAASYAYTNEVGVLIIFGEGAAAALPAGVDRGGIRGVNVEDDVSSIGSRFLKKCYNLNAFTGGANLVTFGEKAFYLCSSLERIEIDNPSFDLEASGLQDAVVYQAAIRPDGTLYTIPAISLPGYKAVLYGTNDLSDPSGWRPVDQGQTMEESGYHFFKYVLEKQGK